LGVSVRRPECVLKGVRIAKHRPGLQCACAVQLDLTLSAECEAECGIENERDTQWGAVQAELSLKKLIEQSAECCHVSSAAAGIISTVGPLYGFNAGLSLLPLMSRFADSKHHSAPSSLSFVGLGP
jgi:hypothetical protein